MHLSPLILDLAVILGVAGAMSLLCQRIRQPVVLGYLVAGAIVGPYTPPLQLVTDLPSIRTWAELGVVFLMFSLGLEFSFRKLARVGTPAATTAVAEVVFFVPAGYAVGRALGWPPMDCLFLGAMLAISSTTIIVRTLGDLKLKSQRFAQVLCGALIVEDLIAFLLLAALTTAATAGSIRAGPLLTAGFELLLVVGGWFTAGYFVIPSVMRYVGRTGNRELLTLLSLGLCLGLVVFASHFDYSPALGAFIMGSILAETPLLHRIEDRMEPLRDLFGAIFFVSVGMLIDPRAIWEHRGAVVLISVFTIVGKVLSSSFGALVAGQSLRDSVRIGFGLAQIGEFSFIIAGLGVALGATSDFLYPVAVAVAVITTFTTPYLIRASEPIAEALERRVPRPARALLELYAQRTEVRRRLAATPRGRARSALWARRGLNGLTITLLFVLGTRALLPRLVETGWVPAPWDATLCWMISAGLAAPFVWGVLSQARTWAGAATVWFGISALSLGFFPGFLGALAGGAGVTLACIACGRFLGVTYRWFEHSFSSTFAVDEPGS